MGKPLNHRVARFLRAALSGTVLLQGIFASWMAVPLHAVDTMQISVTATSIAPPAAVADLLASANPVVEGQISLSWTAPQGNVGGHPLMNWPVASYTLHYATFSVSSLAGDTTSWWNASGASTITLQGPSYVPKAPGQFEAYALSGLISGATYYFGVKSTSQGGIVSPIDTESASPALQASAVATKFSTAANTPPRRPNGLGMSSFGGQFTLNWHPVTLDTNDQPVTIDHYVVYRYDLIGSSPTQSTTVLPSVLSYTDTVGGLTYYYTVVAVSARGVTSAVSDYVDSSSALNRLIIAPDDIYTRVVVPSSIATELNAGKNVYGRDLDVRIVRRQQDEVDVTLRSYRIGAYDTVSGNEVLNFSFSQNDMQVQLGLGATLGAGKLSPAQVQTLQRSAGTGAGSIAQIVWVYWFNGASYIRIGDPILTLDQALSVKVRNLGIYQIRATQLTTTFQLTKNSPYPRVITPNDPSQNNRVFWFFDNPTGDPVTGTVYDIRGARVRDLAVNSQSPTANSLVWDGRDARGAVVPSGVYLYKISAGKESQTGTVVVAR